eukprot:TRINITY_DN35273_c0_g1_i2.p1 TRINITY_DN35273_c0_g1~~TRINITY_DN35273_c0_g1_i2.p1  ORF type:complete len:248 (+),score=68.33 TRINITY_DN35273_c0_g1_i2:110-745(+)
MSTPDPHVDPIWGRRGATLAPSTRSPDKYSVLSQKEKLLLEECQDEAFYYRSIPLSLCFGFGIHTLHDLGQLNLYIFERMPKPVVKWGMVCGAGVLGFWLGQFAYSNHCAAKFVERAPEGVIAWDIRMKAGVQVVPYSIFSPINHEKWRQLAKMREKEELKFNGGRKFDLGFEIDPEFKDQNVLSPNILESRLDDGPVRYGVFKTEENVEQ